MPRKIPPDKKKLALYLLARGRTIKEVEEETGLSNGSIKAIKKELTSSGESSLTDGIDLVEEGSSSNADYITKTEEKYIRRLEGEVSLF